MPHLSICMPSNRPLATSHRAIETALAYCEVKDALLVVSDNSGDAEKRAYWQGRSPRLTYIVDPTLDGTRNFLAAMHGSRTPFLMPMGDDDELAFDPAVPAFDFASLPADHVGVRPITEVWTEAKGVLRVKNYAIAGEKPSDRILEYLGLAGGDNSAFYSIFRRNQYINLMELFSRHHPTRGAYCDWSQLGSLFAYGKMARDAGTTFRYNFEGWKNKTIVDQKIVDSYLAVGLPADSQKYHVLLLYLDMFVFVSARIAGLTPEGMANATAALSGMVFSIFLKEIAERPKNHTDTMRYLAELAAAEPDPIGHFQIALVMANQIRDGLKEDYITYFKAAKTFEGIA